MITINNEFANRHIRSVRLAHGSLADLSRNEHPTRIYSWHTKDLALSDEGTHYGYIIQGVATIRSSNSPRSFELEEGMYFSSPGTTHISGGVGIVMSRIGYFGTLLFGGPIEERGRLRYIDGCSDSVLIPPLTVGDPCLNYLHFPKNILQTRHTHPSIRCTLVVRGRGKCVVPGSDDGTEPDITIPLVPGMLFIIPTNGQHNFITEDDTMDIVVYHPDSDCGPAHDNHPMLNRTLVGGKTANKLPYLWSTELVT